MIAITRPVSPTLAHCELTHVAREPIDVERAVEQHRGYEALLERLGCGIVRVPAAPHLPDAVFVEDTAVVIDRLAVITRPGAESRRPETEGVAGVLAQFCELRVMWSPATLDGGDVLRVGQTLYVGRSGRTNHAGLTQLQAFAEPLGLRVEGVDVRGCLHLKSAVTLVAPGTLLGNREWVNPDRFEGMTWIDIDPAEPWAANALRVGGSVIHPEAFASTRARLEAHGIHVEPIDLSELAKAEGAVTCCSVLIPVLIPGVRS